ncbi:MAG TPA: aldo/keto reductase, partial [Bacillota bacterium]|nr:aldo/keto reductase [Bacillota bacterium]
AASLEQARQQMDRDVVDIFLLHEQESHLTLKGHWEAVEYLVKAKAQGLIKAIGLSTHRVAGVEATLGVAEIEVVHPLFNIAGLGIGDGTREEMLAVIRRARAEGKGIYSMKPLGGGNLRKDMREAIDYVLTRPECDAIALGMRSEAEVAMNLALFNGEAVPAAAAAAVSGIARYLQIDQWCTGCGRCVDKCSTGALTLENGKAVVRPELCLLCGYCGAQCQDFYIKIV